MHVIIMAAVIFSKQVTLCMSKGMFVNFHTGKSTRLSTSDTWLIFIERVGQYKVQGSHQSFSLTKSMSEMSTKTDDALFPTDLIKWCSLISVSV